MTTDLTPAESEQFTAVLEGFFEHAGMEAHADVVALVLAREGEGGGPDRVAGIPGAATTIHLTAAVAEWYCALTREFLARSRGAAAEHGSTSVAGRMIGWIKAREKKRRTPFRTVDVSKRLDTIADIARTLQEADWPPDQVEAAAHDLWMRSKMFAREASGGAGGAVFAALHGLLMTLFDEPELRLFVRALPSRGGASEGLRGPPIRLSELVTDAIDALEHRGCIDDAFFVVLGDRRPNYRTEVERVAREWRSEHGRPGVPVQ